MGNTILFGSLFASALVILKPFEFGLKWFLHWQMADSFKAAFLQKLLEFKPLEPTLLPSTPTVNKGYFYNIFSSPYLAQTRSTIIGAINLCFIIGVIMIRIIAQPTSMVFKWAFILLEVMLFFILIKIGQEVRRSDSKLLNVATYYYLIQYKIAETHEVSILRQALEEGNWEEASSWLQNLKDRKQ